VKLFFNVINNIEKRLSLVSRTRVWSRGLRDSHPSLFICAVVCVVVQSCGQVLGTPYCTVTAHLHVDSEVG